MMRSAPQPPLAVEPCCTDGALTEPLLTFLRASRRLFVLTGAGISTASGIPDYRDADGRWKHRQPMSYREFVHSERARQRYWARSFTGWRRMAKAEPNAAHHALAVLDRAGRVELLVTQNVDGLHRKAGSRRSLDLHGRLDTVQCLGCGLRFRRDAFQSELARLNPDWAGIRPGDVERPDGDVELEDAATAEFRVPSCPVCGGVLKPAVVFFGEMVPRHRVQRAYAAVDAADAVLVVGSSLMVRSGLRFVLAAAERGVRVALLNLGVTRADAHATVKIEARCDEVLPEVVARLMGPAA
jgi:NAD-dependent SIR2 family protein deacetylase